MSDLYKNLLAYSKSDYYPFHMPGHKRNMPEGVNPYSYDITEIEGFDNLHEPTGILRIAKEEAARFYESDKTYYLVNGSTCGLLSAISGTTRRGESVLVARNCHKAVYHAIDLNGLRPVYVMPEYIDLYGINGGIAPERVEEALSENPEIHTVIITSPTYEGVVSDVRAIADIVHRHNGILIVDEAHGAHFGMHRNLPKPALACGADLVIQSLHKTLPALTQTALLHIKSERVNVANVERFLSIYQTSSPSYVLMSSIGECIRKIQTDGILMFEPYLKRLEVLGEHIRQLTHLKVVGREIVGKNAVFDLDPSKIVLSFRGTYYTGKQAYEELLERYHLQLEMSSSDYVIAMTSPMDTQEGLLRLFTAMTEIDRNLRINETDREKRETYRYELPVPSVVESICDAQSANKEALHLGTEALGKISASYIYLYPPGSPVLAPGELVTSEVIALVRAYQESGQEVHGPLADNQIMVMKEEFRRINLTKGIYYTK